MPNIENDTWLETVDVHEDECMIGGCSSVATYEALMKLPCGHRFLFCLPHKDDHAQVQDTAGPLGPLAGWTCARDGKFVGVIVKWSPVRG